MHYTRRVSDRSFLKLFWMCLLGPLRYTSILRPKDVFQILSVWTIYAVIDPTRAGVIIFLCVNAKDQEALEDLGVKRNTKSALLTGLTSAKTQSLLIGVLVVLMVKS